MKQENNLNNEIIADWWGIPWYKINTKSNLTWSNYRYKPANKCNINYSYLSFFLFLNINSQEIFSINNDNKCSTVQLLTSKECQYMLIHVNVIDLLILLFLSFSISKNLLAFTWFNPFTWLQFKSISSLLVAKSVVVILLYNQNKEHRTKIDNHRSQRSLTFSYKRVQLF